MGKTSKKLSMSSLGRDLAIHNHEGVDGWGDDEFTEYASQHALEDGEDIRRVSWRRGSVAGIRKVLNCFIGYDDAEMYGPFATYREAILKGPDLSADRDELLEDYTHPEYLGRAGKMRR